MTHRPVIGIMCCNRIVETQTAQTVMNRYVEAMMRYGDVAALLIPARPDLMHPRDVAARLDGVLLTGSPSNIGATHYGEADGDGPFDPARDEMTMGLIQAMIERQAPVFGICRGFQEINVALGGTLRRDVSSNPDLLLHHAPDGVDFSAMFDHHHPVTLTPHGILATAYKKTALTVKSVHFQGIGALSPLLSIEATAADGVIEAVSATINATPILAVQWHPEWRTDLDSDSQLFFKLLGQTVRATIKK